MPGLPGFCPESHRTRRIRHSPGSGRVKENPRRAAVLRMVYTMTDVLRYLCPLSRQDISTSRLRSRKGREICLSTAEQ